jgi:hypothetical protein
VAAGEMSAEGKGSCSADAGVRSLILVHTYL